MALTKRNTKGSPLSHAEMDANWDHVIDADNQVFEPYSYIAATDVQSAVEEMVDDLAASTGSSRVGFAQSGSGAVTAELQSWLRLQKIVHGWIPTNLWAGISDGSGTTNLGSYIIAALAAIPSGSKLRMPAGTYRWHRGDGALAADTIVASNITISGDGPGTIIQGRNSSGSISNDSGNEFYNLFQATSRDNLVIENLAVTGYTCLGYFDSCDNVTVRGVTVNGLLANAGGYLFNKSVYFKNCTRVKVIGNDFTNGEFAVYLSGASGTRTRDVTVTGNTFEHNTAAGSFTSLFPVGVYVHFADEVNVTGNTFRNIYSSLDNGGTGDGMGYGVYEGDGEVKSLIVTGNTFDYTGNGSKNATAIYINEALDANISGNTITTDSNGRLVNGVLVDSKVTATSRAVLNNTMTSLHTGFDHYAVYLTGTDTDHVCNANISGNTVTGFTNAVRVDSGICTAVGSVVQISNNTCKGQLASGIQMEGAAGSPLKIPKIIGNTILASQTNGILFNNYTLSPHVFGNTILDGNLANGSTDAGAAIRFANNSQGSTIAGNVIGNTPGGGGLFTWGIENASNAVDRIFKDVISGNTFLALSLGEGAWAGRYYSASPTNGIADIFYNDFITNSSFAASGVPGWYCVRARESSITSDASSASTTVTVASTSGMANGDIVLLLKNSNPYDADYYTATSWHIDTVASVTDATNFVLTTGIPAGDGTYTGGTAIMKFARFKAAAAIAA